MGRGSSKPTTQEVTTDVDTAVDSTIIDTPSGDSTHEGDVVVYNGFHLDG